MVPEGVQGLRCNSATAHLQVPIVRTLCIRMHAPRAIVQRVQCRIEETKSAITIEEQGPRTPPATVISHCRYYSLSPLRCRSKMHSRILERAPGEV